MTRDGWPCGYLYSRQSLLQRALISRAGLIINLCSAFIISHKMNKEKDFVAF